MVVVGAILVQLALGAIYAWSVFTAPLKAEPYNFTAAQTQAIFSAGLFTFALVMIFAGIQMKKTGPRPLTIASALVLGSGYILGSFLGSSFIMQFICIGILGGAGIGLGYVVPIAVGMKWFPDKKGLVSGLAVAGFGFGATIWVKVAGSWFHLIERFGVQNVFLYYGIAFMALVLLGSLWMVNPPEGYSPRGYAPAGAGAAKGASSATMDCTWQIMLARVQFWTLWLVFAFGAMAGLMVIGNIVLYGRDALQASGLTAEAAAAAAGTAMAWYAIFNGLGRIVWGKVSDSIGPRQSIIIMSIIQGGLLLSLYSMGNSPLLLAVYASAIGFNFGGNFALMPTGCAVLFGTKNIGSNYPFLFTAYGIAGIVGPMLGGFVRDTTGSYLWAFIPAGIACLVGAVLAFSLRPSPRVAHA
ncbi:MAG: L-lactate MFS transporter, partial [Candidatus Latescibacterota bacterium]